MVKLRMFAIALIQMLVIHGGRLRLCLASSSCLLGYRRELLLIKLLSSLLWVDDLHGCTVLLGLASLMTRSQLLLGLVTDAGRRLLRQVHSNRCLSVDFDCAAGHADIGGGHCRVLLGLSLLLQLQGVDEETCRDGLKVRLG